MSGCQTPLATMLPVSIASLIEHETLPFDIYVLSPHQSNPTLFRGRNYPISREDLTKLRSRGTLNLYVCASDQEAYRSYLREQVLANEALPPAQRLKAISDASKEVYLHALATRCPDVAVEATNSIADDLVRVIWHSPQLLGELLDVMTHDYSTYHHACNVSVYAMLLAMEYFRADQATTVRIAQGALLHDIGKKHISASLLNKVGTLDPAEMDELKLHPQAGFEFLCNCPGLQAGQLMMVMQHHERCDGEGYPMALFGSEIHPWALLCAVVDVFDALVSHRAYRGGYRVSDALEYLDLQGGRGFDEDLVRCFASIANRKS